MIIVVGKEQAEEALKSLRDNGEKEAFVIGEVVAKPGVEYVNMDRWN
jgi:phosphoribosylamine--glycine ligase/phosphoribosylformylglycinamidine cyclo-ligase